MGGGINDRTSSVNVLKRNVKERERGGEWNVEKHWVGMFHGL